MGTSPTAVTSTSTRAWRAIVSSMWERKPTGVSMRAAPLPSRSSATCTDVSFVVRESSARRIAERLQEAVVLRAVADGDAQRVRNRMRDVADEDAARAQLLEQLLRVAAR